jgi:hypothetical protein
MITQFELKQIFEYKNGNLYWKIKISNKNNIGQKAGSINPQGYNRIRINGKYYAAHRLIFLFHHGYLGECIDHIDGNPLNNNIENLRIATKSQNCQNAKLSIRSASKVKGVSWSEKSKKWQVTFGINGKTKYFGCYFDKDVARFVAETMRYKYHKEFANHGY